VDNVLKQRWQRFYSIIFFSMIYRKSEQEKFSTNACVKIVFSVGKRDF
jgi:hypothetical protein